MTEPAQVVLLGDPRLRRRSRSIAGVEPEVLSLARAELLATLAEFRRVQGFGRAIAAPQIGHDLRLIALNLGDERGAFTIGDPEIVRRSEATLTLWDDCMSFPSLMVRVRRHRSIDLRFVDERGGIQTWADLDPSLSELLQHEIDHLEGVLATDRAEAGLGESLISREVYLARREHFDAMVDLAIVPTI
ncbi:peptide deformylase [Nannocystaceae bacterium ST9]